MIGMQPWCCARQCSQAHSGTLQVLRQIPVTISKPVFLSSECNFAKKGISAMKAEATSLPCSMSSQLCQEEAKGAAAKIFMCVQSALSFLSFLEMSVLSWKKKSPSSAPRTSQPGAEMGNQVVG